jgi:hypothetical protein
MKATSRACNVNLFTAVIDTFRLKITGGFTPETLVTLGLIFVSCCSTLLFHKYKVQAEVFGIEKTR